MAEPAGLIWTGERYIPAIGGQVRTEHLHRYGLASFLAGHKRVLDIACGEGYGSNMLSRVAKQVCGVDVSVNAIEHASSKYNGRNIEFRVGHCAEIPYPSMVFDLVVCFETLEHHDQHSEMIAEIKRVLRSDGVFLISCPDKLNYSDIPGFRNPFHVKELYKDEFFSLLKQNFKSVAFYGQKCAYGSLISPLMKHAICNEYFEVAEENGLVEFSAGLSEPIYLIAIASDKSLPAVPISFFDSTSALLLESIQIALGDFASKEGPLVGQLRSQFAAKYRLGDFVDFRLGGNALLYQNSAWGEPGEGGCWSIGGEASVFLDIVEPFKSGGTLVLEVEGCGFVCDLHAETLVEILINDLLVGKIGFSDYATHAFDVDLFKVKKAGSDITIVFKVLNPVSPSSLGFSTDCRVLGVFISQLRVTVRP